MPQTGSPSQLDKRAGVAYIGGMEQVAYEAGVPSFPTLDSGDGFMRPLKAWRATLAEAWAWRVADTMPDGEQSRRDALADAETLHTVCGEWGDLGRDLLVARFDGWRAGMDMYGLGHGFAVSAARAAFRACPGLRGEP